ncbi:MAG: M24 family metallopeptidase, partial [Candidatus Binatia bacterium]
QMENAAVVLPTDSRPPIIINDRDEGNEWWPDARSVLRHVEGSGRQRGSWGPAMAKALLDAGMERARIGVVGLGRGKVTHGRAVDGVIVHSSYTEVLRRLPNAKFEDATNVVGFARYVKGEEEIVCLRRGAHIAAAGLEEMVRVARPGIKASLLYARVMRKMLELGSEYYPWVMFAAPIGQRSFRYQDPPIGLQLQRLFLITNETAAVWGGLIAQELQPLLLGSMPGEWEPVIDLQRDIFHAGLEFMKPGRLIGELIDFVNGFGAKRGMRTLTLMHGRGYGNDGPLITPQDPRAEHFRDVPIMKGNVFVWKPIAYSADGQIQFSWGGVVVITDKGGEMVTGRSPGMMTIQSISC